MDHHYGDVLRPETWDRYVGALAALPPDIKVVGITDYFSVEGYARVREAHASGKLPNLELILPVVEIRLSSFVGSSTLQRLNFHTVFSDDLDPEQIENFFLRSLNVDLNLEGAEPWSGCVGTREGLAELGRAVRAATPISKRIDESDLRIGFRNAAIPLEKIWELLGQSKFRGKVLSALGLSEWDQMRWEGAGSAQKRDVAGRVDFFLTSSPTVEKYKERCSQLRDSEVNSRLFDASDAHYYSDSAEPNRLGQCRCWVKADLTFAGLRRAVQRFDDRVFIGDVPPKLARIRTRPTRYIRNIEIRKKPDSKLDEIWFDSCVELNPDLVAIIGNQGTGKSALTDAIALCGGSTTQGFSFLTHSRFLDKDNRARHFQASLTWHDGTITTRSLDATADTTDVERVRYVPQNFFDLVTNETSVAGAGRFYSEIKKAVYSHIPPSERLACATFDELVAAHTNGLTAKLAQLREELSETNTRMITFETATSTSSVDAVRSQLTQREADAAGLRATPPPPVERPQGVGAGEGRMERFIEEEVEIRRLLAIATSDNGQLKRRLVALQNAKESLRTASRKVGASVATIAEDLKAAGVDFDLTSSLTVSLNLGPVQAAIGACNGDLQQAAANLDSSRGGSLAFRGAALAAERASIEQAQELNAREYNAYLKRVDDWKAILVNIEGPDDGSDRESISGLRRQLDDLVDIIPKELVILRNRRKSLCKAIYDTIATLQDVYTTLTKPVQAHILSDPVVHDRYRLSFDVAIRQVGLADKLFNCIGRTTGTFSGGEKGIDRLRKLIAAADFTSAEGAAAFADTLLDHVRRNHKEQPPTAVDLSTVLRKGTDAQTLYDLIFSLDYLALAFSLALNGKPLRQLSPGERGILLLVFYLVVDCGDEPLIIDQPEGNLNNQSIVENLVPVFKAAKGRRQVIVVTHNPNLAVVCDAEQIVHCQMDVEAGSRILYDSGTLENPKFNRLSLDLLEGTASAFAIRGETYGEDMTVLLAGTRPPPNVA